MVDVVVKFFLLLLLVCVCVCVRLNSNSAISLSPLLATFFWYSHSFIGNRIIFIVITIIFHYKHWCRSNQPPKNNFPPFFPLSLTLCAPFRFLCRLWYIALSKSYCMWAALNSIVCLSWGYIPLNTMRISTLFVCGNIQITQFKMLFFCVCVCAYFTLSSIVRLFCFRLVFILRCCFFFLTAVLFMP